jgi:GTPase Era involved in 16S rRNA processing
MAEQNGAYAAGTGRRDGFQAAGVGYLDLIRGVNRDLETSSSPRAPLWPTGEVQNLESLFWTAESMDEKLIRVGVVGEVKAGKSTLVNALVDRLVVPVDILEMTAWVTHVQPTSDQGFCLIEMRDGAAEAHDPEAFFKSVSERTLSKDFIRQIKRVVLGCDTKLPFVLVDAPGIGAVTRENESLLVETLRELDVVLWTVDCDSLGSLRDVALTGRIRQLGLPMWAVITMCDKLKSRAESDEVLTWVADNGGFGSTRIYPVSALCFMDRGKPLGGGLDNDGIQALKTALEADVQGREQAIRTAARKSRETEFCREAILMGGRALEQLSAARTGVEQFRRLMTELGEAVSRSAENYIKDEVRENLFSEFRDQLVIDLKRACGNKLKTLEAHPSLMSQTVQTGVPPEYITKFWTDLQTRLAGEVRSRWEYHLDEASEQINGLLAGFEWQTANELSQALPSLVVLGAISIDDYAGAVFNTVFGAGVATAIGATAWAAWFGANAAAVSFGAAATGIGLPIAAVGAGIAAACAVIARRKAQAQFADAIDNYLVDLREMFIKEVLEPQVFPALREANQRLAEDCVERFAAGLEGHFPQDKLAGTIRSLEESLDRVAVFCASRA